jgi:hypothetical protein
MSYIESLHKNAVRALHLCLLRAKGTCGTPLSRDLRRKIIITAFKSISSLEWAPGLVLVNDLRDYDYLSIAVCAPKGWVIDFGEQIPPPLYGIGSTGEIVFEVYPASIANLRLLLRPETRIEKYTTKVKIGLQTKYATWIVYLFSIWLIYDTHMYFANISQI